MANEEYLEMIELPVSTCEMVMAPQKKKFKKSRLLKRLNKKMDEASAAPEEKKVDKEPEEDPSNVVLYEKKKEKKFKFDIVAAQVVAVFALVVAIILTNVFWEQSGINTLIKSVFKTETATSDERAYTAFKLTLPASSDSVSAEGGVMSVSENSAVYSPADGTVTDVYSKDGVYTITVSHSDKFKSIVTGLEYAYAGKGDKVYSGIPVGFNRESDCKIAMYQDGSLINNYTLENGAIVWKS